MKIFVDQHGVRHGVTSERQNRSTGGNDIDTACGQRWNVVRPLKKGSIDCMACVAAVGSEGTEVPLGPW